MTALEDTFRAVLADRVPKGPGWGAWIDGVVAELAAADDRRRTVECDTIRNQQQRIDAVLALCDEEERPSSGGYVSVRDVRELLGAAS